VQLDGRTQQGDFYRYGFNGMEGDSEFKGQGNSYTTEFRQYDARLGRWLSLDPMEKKYPSFSPYSAFNNNPIYFIDPKGLEGEDPKSSKTEKGAGNKELKLPQDAVVKGRFVDQDKNGVINHGKKILDAKPGDVDRFSIGDKDYVANFDSKGKFNGYVNKAGEMYSFNENKSNGNSPKSNFSNQLSFRGWDDQNPPFESAGIFGELNLNTPWEGNSISASADNTQEGTIETSIIKSRQTDIFGIPKVGVSGGAGFNLKTREGHIEADAYKQFEISTSIGYLGISYYSNSKGEKGFKFNPSLGYDLFPFSITNSTILDEKK
jgi:RHS repeat-associated protein